MIWFLLILTVTVSSLPEWPENRLMEKLLDNYDPDVSPFDAKMGAMRHDDMHNLTIAEESGNW